MALRDSSGKITIDEVAAAQDIRKIGSAIESLEASGKAVDNILRQADGEKGQTMVATIEKASELRRNINDMIRRLNETRSFIQRTVAHYQEVDRQVKAAIEASRIAASASAPVVGAVKNVAQTTTSVPKTASSSKSSSSKSSSSKSSSSKSSNNKKDLSDVLGGLVDFFKK